ncbi:MAG TPA: glycosyltransferase family 4 protein [Burkholderiales bacterium]
MKICFVGLDNLPVLAPEYRRELIGGESVQQTLLARALARRGHEVSMVTADYGQHDGAVWDGVRVYKAYGFDAGLPVLRFLHPRATGLWAALRRADADLYYTSCAGAQVGLAAMFCARHRRRLVFRAASDADCDPARLLIRYARDRWLYRYGLRHADAVLVQSAFQARTLERCYALPSRYAGMLVEAPAPPQRRDIDVLWVSNIRPLKRPDRALRLADWLPEAAIHMAGGPLRGEEALYEEVERAASARPNITFHGRLPYAVAAALYDRARLLVNTSDVEGFPNAYLQAWIRGVPVVTLIDPDRVIEREGLGIAVRTPEGLPAAADALLRQPVAWRAASARCRAFMAREYGEEKILAPYFAAFDQAMRVGATAAGRLHHA